MYINILHSPSQVNSFLFISKFVHFDLLSDWNCTAETALGLSRRPLWVMHKSHLLTQNPFAGGGFSINQCVVAMGYNLLTKTLDFSLNQCSRCYYL